MHDRHCLAVGKSRWHIMLQWKNFPRNHYIFHLSTFQPLFEKGLNLPSQRLLHFLKPIFEVSLQSLEAYPRSRQQLLCPFNNQFFLGAPEGLKSIMNNCPDSLMHFCNESLLDFLSRVIG